MTCRNQLIVGSGGGWSQAPARTLLCLALAALVQVGCNRLAELAPAQGKVLLPNGQPLTSGVVRFQPESGQFARGTIQSDGTFQLETRGRGPGATVGWNKVAIVATQQVAVSEDQEVPTGQSLIPRKYQFETTSGIRLEVKSAKSGEVNDFLIQLEPR